PGFLDHHPHPHHDRRRRHRVRARRGGGGADLRPDLGTAAPGALVSGNHLRPDPDRLHDVRATWSVQRPAPAPKSATPGRVGLRPDDCKGAAMTTPLLNIAGLTVRFGGLTAVDDLSFQVQSGQIHALIGPNGAGKSTTFNCISRYYDPTGGSIAFAGEDITHRDASEMARLGVARTFQNLELFNELNVEENALLGTYSYGARRLGQLLRRPSGEHREHAHHLLERVGLIDFLDHKASSLDFGRQKM